MKPISMDLRQRIVSSYNNNEGSMQTIADRYKVSRESVKNFLLRQKKLGHLNPLPMPGRKRVFTGDLEQCLDSFVKDRPDATLEQIKAAFGDRISCSIPTIHNALKRLKYTYKKSLCERRSKTEKTSRLKGKNGQNGNNLWMQANSFLLMSRGQKRI